mmetsp:Transcript_15274/g.32136  ORF Transcript_15274/g.32136 Transcript_15274/m.32136 type:complete len:261 (-) Transcript_15274:185-967(-)
MAPPVPLVHAAGIAVAVGAGEDEMAAACVKDDLEGHRRGAHGERAPIGALVVHHIADGLHSHVLARELQPDELAIIHLRDRSFCNCSGAEGHFRRLRSKSLCSRCGAKGHFRRLLLFPLPLLSIRRRQVALHREGRRGISVRGSSALEGEGRKGEQQGQCYRCRCKRRPASPPGRSADLRRGLLGRGSRGTRLTHLLLGLLLRLRLWLRPRLRLRLWFPPWRPRRPRWRGSVQVRLDLGRRRERLGLGLRGTGCLRRTSP